MWEPGKSGNPRGRPRKTPEQLEFENKCRKFLKEFGYQEIEAMAKSAVKADKKWALEIMLDRGHGKPEQFHDVESRTGAIDSSPSGLAEGITGIIGGEAIPGIGDGSASGSGSQS